MEKLTTSLRVLGYSNKESMAYIALLQLGRGTAYSIAEKSGLKKPTAHVILSELLKKGAVITIPGAKKKMFAARPPEDIFALAEEKFNQAKNALPALRSMVVESRSEFKTLYFEGLNGLKEAQYYKMDSSTGKELVGFYAVAEKITPETKKIFDTWDKDLIKSGIRVRGFTPEHASTDVYRFNKNKHHQDIRGLPFNLYSSEISIEAQDTFIRITDILHLQSVVIDNPNIAKTVRQLFELLWSKY